MTPRYPGLTICLVHYLLNGDIFFTLEDCEPNLTAPLVYRCTETHPCRVSLSRTSLYTLDSAGVQTSWVSQGTNNSESIDLFWSKPCQMTLKLHLPLSRLYENAL